MSELTLAEKVTRSPSIKETGDATGKVTDWRQCAILCLTPTRVAWARGGGLNRKTIKTRLNQERAKLRREGWQFLPLAAPMREGCVPLRPVEPGGITTQTKAAEAVWEAEVSRQTRSNWGMRTRPGKAPGS